MWFHLFPLITKEWPNVWRTSPWAVSKTPCAQGGPWSEIRNVWHHWWEGPSDHSVDEEPKSWERLPPMKSKSYEIMVLTYAKLMVCGFENALKQLNWSCELGKFHWGAIPRQHPHATVAWERLLGLPRFKQAWLPQYLPKWENWGIHRHLLEVYMMMKGLFIKI